jgi:hypothetical protein
MNADGLKVSTNNSICVRFMEGKKPTHVILAVDILFPAFQTLPPFTKLNLSRMDDQLESLRVVQSEFRR